MDGFTDDDAIGWLQITAENWNAPGMSDAAEVFSFAPPKEILLYVAARLRQQSEDSARYQWLKREYSTYGYDQRSPTVLDNYSESWDAAIDKARKA